MTCHSRTIILLILDASQSQEIQKAWYSIVKIPIIITMSNVQVRMSTDKLCLNISLFSYYDIRLVGIPHHRLPYPWLEIL